MYRYVEKPCEGSFVKQQFFEVVSLMWMQIFMPCWPLNDAGVRAPTPHAVENDGNFRLPENY